MRAAIRGFWHGGFRGCSPGFFHSQVGAAIGGIIAGAAYLWSLW